MDENKNAEVIDEQNLKHVVGGTSEPKHCWFKCAELNAEVETRNGERRMWCDNKICTSGCACHGTRNCIDAWHLMNDEGQSPKLVPAGYKNHDAKNNNGIKRRYVDPEAPLPIWS
jgi:hypothetical protein